ncbi:HEAT repeat family protein [Cryptosporidium felis]|nr:HEAT repeat family protein [Cryptosporidium felis]
MELPNQLKKGNICGMVNIKDESKIMTVCPEKEVGYSNRKMEQIEVFFDILGNKTPRLADFAGLNLKKIHSEIKKCDYHSLSRYFCKDRLNKNCELILEEIIESELILDFNKKILGNGKEKLLDSVLDESITPIAYVISIFLYFEMLLLNEQTLSKEFRILANITRTILPVVLSENVRNIHLEAFNEAFIGCLENVDSISRARNIPEVYSTQLILGLLAIFSIEDSTPTISRLVVDIIVQLFVSGSLYSNNFLENTFNLILNTMDSIPQTGRAIKKLRICIELDSSMHIYVYLLIRIIQSTCVPNGINPDDNLASLKQISVKRYNLAKFMCSQFATFFINEITLQRTKRRDTHYSIGSDIATVILTDLIKASLSPKYNICSTIVQLILIQIIKLLNRSLTNEEDKEKSRSINLDQYSKELCLNLLGTSLTIICKIIGLSLSTVEFTGNTTREEIKGGLGKGDLDDSNSKENPKCPCMNSDLLPKQEIIICGRCKREFHKNCSCNETYLEIYEDWKCEKCTLSSLFDEINTCFKVNGEGFLPAESSELGVVLMLVLDCLFRKTAFTVTQINSDSSESASAKIVTDPEISVTCTYILEMISRLKLGLNKSGVEKEETSRTSKRRTKNRSNEFIMNQDNIDQFHAMLLTEWTSPITKVHSPLISYSSKLPKLMEANTYKLWNRILIKDFQIIGNLILHCILSNIYNSTITSMRRISLNFLGQVVLVVPSLVFKSEVVLNAIVMSFKDKTPKVRERALAIAEKLFSDIVPFESNSCFKIGNIGADDFERVTRLLQEYIFKTAYDVSPLVRMASIKILKALFQRNPDKLNIGAILLKRASSLEETQAIKKLIFDSFVLLWFHNSSSVNIQMAENLVRVINYSESSEFLQSINHNNRYTNHFLNGILLSIQESQTNQDVDSLITRWSNILVDMFINSERISQNSPGVVLNNESSADIKKKMSSNCTEKNNYREFSEKKLQILKTAQVIGKIYPRSITEIYSYIVVYLKDFSQFKSDVMIHICTVLSYILPYIGDLEAENIELDLIRIMTDSRSPQLIRSSILCLCNLISKNDEMKLNENTILSPVILENMRILWDYREKMMNSKLELNLKEIDQVRRSAWLLGCIFEYSCPRLAVAIVNKRLERTKIVETEFGISWVVDSHATDEEQGGFGKNLGFEDAVFESSNVVFDLICDLFYYLDWNLNKGVLFPTLVQFLINQRQFVKSIKFNNLIKSILKGEIVFLEEQEMTLNESMLLNSNLKLSNKENPSLCIMCLQGVLSLLINYEQQGQREKKINHEDDSEFSKITGVSVALEQNSQFHDETNQFGERNSIGNGVFTTPSTRKRQNNQPERNEVVSPVSSSSFSNTENISSIRTSVFRSASQITSSASASQPIASHLDLFLSLFGETMGNSQGRFPAQQRQLVTSLLLCIIEQLNKQGLVNPTSIIPQISGLLFSAYREVSFKSYQIISSLFERFPNLIINKFKEISIFGFLHCSSNFPSLLGVYQSNTCSEENFFSIFSNEVVPEKVHSRSRSEVLETTLEFFVKIYAEKCRKKKALRENVINGCCKQLKSLLSNDGTEDLLKRLTSTLNIQKRNILVIYVEFISYIILALPYTFESEILLVLYSLGEICVSCTQNLPSEFEQNIKADLGEQSFRNALLASVCTTIQLILKEEYRISESHISNFDPYNSIVKEKPKFLHLDLELSAGNASDGSANTIALNRGTVYGSLRDLREKLNRIWEISNSIDPSEKLAEFTNEVIYSFAQTTTVRASRPTKKYAKKKQSKRSREVDECSDSSSQSWSPSKITKNRK